MSAGLEILPVDPYDAPAVDALHAAYLAAERATGDAASPWQLEELRAALQDDGATSSFCAWAGKSEGTVVTTGVLRLSRLHNLDRAEVAVHTVPEARRRGHGTVMLRHLEREAAAEGRSVLAAESVWPHAAGPAGEGEPGAEFARSSGFALALG